MTLKRGKFFDSIANGLGIGLGVAIGTVLGTFVTNKYIKPKLGVNAFT